jgi:hypothetical protein
VPACGTHVPPPQASLKAATLKEVGPIKVEFAGVVKLTWNFHRFRRFVPKLSKKFGEPAGGTVAPSRSDGSKPPNDEES